MNSMVAIKMFWLSSNLNFSLPYKSRCTSSSSARKGDDRNMGFATLKRAFLWMIKVDQWSKIWHVVSATLSEQLQVSNGVSRKWCAFLWLFRGLKRTRSWKIHLVPLSCMLYSFFLWAVYFQKFSFEDRYCLGTSQLRSQIVPHGNTIWKVAVTVPFSFTCDIFEDVLGTDAI